VDVVLEINGKTLPLEVKAGANPKSKSLRVYRENFLPPLLLRTSLLNGKQDDNMVNIPLYAIGHLTKLVGG